jgi:hypothetical protein
MGGAEGGREERCMDLFSVGSTIAKVLKAQLDIAVRSNDQS